MIVDYTNSSFFYGVVEDRLDPLKLGRVRVRVYSLHPYQNKEDPVSGLRTEDLLWMSVLSPINSASVSGVGSSPVGILPGTHVFGVYLDKYYLNGLVLGTTTGRVFEEPNKTTGFSDPLGVYPQRIGPDPDELTIGGNTGLESTSITSNERNLEFAVNPSENPSTVENIDPEPNYTLDKMLTRDEGVRLKVYWDQTNKPHIGIGHLIIDEVTRDMDKISKALSLDVGREVHDTIIMADVNKLFDDDLERTLSGMEKHSLIGPVLIELDVARKMALVNMAFQLGVGGLGKFVKALDAMKKKDWVRVAKELKDSNWHNQTPGRANRIIRIFQTGNLESYGVPIKESPGKRSIRQVTSSSPEAPFTPEDSRIMFKEPGTAYKGEYPYVSVTKSEGGHITEMDSTPGHERLKVIHPSGTYTETRPDGTMVNKIVGEDYKIVEGNGHLKISGNLKFVVEGSTNIYIMGDVNQTIDGNVVQHVGGDSSSRIEGNNDSLIFGNNNSVVQGNSTIHVEGDTNTKVDGNYTLEVGGSYTEKISGDKNQVISGSWSRTANSVYDVASTTFTVDASRINIG